MAINNELFPGTSIVIGTKILGRSLELGRLDSFVFRSFSYGAAAPPRGVACIKPYLIPPSLPIGPPIKLQLFGIAADLSDFLLGSAYTRMRSTLSARFVRLCYGIHEWLEQVKLSSTH